MICTREYNTAVKEYSRNIFRYVYKCIKDEDEAKDIVQDCYLKLWTHRANVNPDKIKYWLFTTAHNTMLNHLKKSSKVVPMEGLSNIDPFEVPNDGFDLKGLIDKSLDLLPQVQKTIIILRDLEGYNYNEIGEMLDLSESQVKVYLFRARQKMKESLKELNKYYENN